VSVCHGTEATWQTLGKTMRMCPEDYICNCGPQSAPGGKVYDLWNSPDCTARGLATPSSSR
ncbi:MAG: hypothetical protein ABSE73_20525, partial [Planctomycetota bacterium]